MELRRGFFHRRERKMPGLNTSALPDLIFTVLFFFMIVTHMRDVNLLVHYDVPQGTEVQKLTHKSAVTYIYVGRMEAENGMATQPDSFFIQLNNRIATVADISKFVEDERSKMSIEDQARMVVSLKADRDVPMSIIADIKRALQKSFALRINYSAREKGNLAKPNK
jgi:biopolymer transport protein ExbD